MNIGRKNLFGFTQNNGRSKPTKSDWFDPSNIWVQGEETLPDDDAPKPRYVLAQFLLVMSGLLLKF